MESIERCMRFVYAFSFSLLFYPVHTYLLRVVEISSIETILHTKTVYTILITIPLIFECVSKERTHTVSPVL